MGPQHAYVVSPPSIPSSSPFRPHALSTYLIALFTLLATIVHHDDTGLLLDSCMHRNDPVATVRQLTPSPATSAFLTVILSSCSLQGAIAYQHTCMPFNKTSFVPVWPDTAGSRSFTSQGPAHMHSHSISLLLHREYIPLPPPSSKYCEPPLSASSCTSHGVPAQRTTKPVLMGY